MSDEKVGKRRVRRNGLKARKPELPAEDEKNPYCELSDDDLRYVMDRNRKVIIIANGTIDLATKQIGLVLEEMRSRAAKKGDET